MLKSNMSHAIRSDKTVKVAQLGAKHWLLVIAAVIIAANVLNVHTDLLMMH